VKAKKEPEEPVKKVETVPAPSPAQLIQAEYQQLVLVSIVSFLILVCSVPDPDPPDQRVFGLPDPLVRGMDPDPALDPDPSIIMQK
jgi:hypothetical protein